MNTNRLPNQIELDFLMEQCERLKYERRMNAGTWWAHCLDRDMEDAESDEVYKKKFEENESEIDGFIPKLESYINYLKKITEITIRPEEELKELSIKKSILDVSSSK